MKSFLDKSIFARKEAYFLAVMFIFASILPISMLASDAVISDIKANGSDGVVLINDGDSYSYSWNSDNATACVIDTPSGTSGISLSGNDGPIESGHPWYPTLENSVTLTLDCTDGVDNVTDTVEVKIIEPVTEVEPITLDIKANDSDGPVTITNGSSYNYSWTSTGATACTLTSPSGESGISTSGNDGPIVPGHPWYPATSSPVTLTLNCTNGTDNDTDSVTIQLTSGGGGGGNPVDPTFTIVATKIVCDSESDLPNWHGAADIGPNTATNFVSENSNCHLESGWDFQWAPINSLDPGKSFVGQAPTPWTTFPSSTNSQGVASITLEVPEDNFVWVREVLKAGYIHFGGGIGEYPGSDISAEFYCDKDVLNYDNYDYIENIQADTTYYCIAFNVLSDDNTNPEEVTTDIKANDSDGPVTITNGSSYNYSWTSTGATACTLTSPSGESGISTSGNDGPIVPGHPWYPATSSPVTLTLNCTNGTDNDTDSVTIQLTSGGGGGGNTPVCPLPSITSSLAASATINQSFSYTLTATTTGITTATTTRFTVATSSLPDGLSFSTTTNVISGTPTETGTFNIEITALTDCGSDSKTLVISVNNEGGGGGGGGGGGRRSSGGSVLGTSTLECFYLRDYMRRDFNNDPMEVLKLQAFLINFEGHNNLALTGVFDDATYNAVSAFQTKYFKDILEPWGHTGPTGYVYILTLKKVNEIYCQRIFPLNQAQINEIAAFRALLESLRSRGINPVLPEPGQVGGVSTTTVPGTPTPPATPPAPQGQNDECLCLSALLMAWPDNIMDKIKCVYWIILILFVLYILGTILRDVLYTDVPLNQRKRFLTKWSVITVGTTIALVVAYIFAWICLILPLLIALIISLIWMASYTEHNSIRASVKSWYLVGSARARSMWRKNGKGNVTVLPLETDSSKTKTADTENLTEDTTKLLK